MIDTENLCTASLYINNQLVSRGLLRDGQAIDFGQVAGDGHGSATTAIRIISVVNDLILRRDVRTTRTHDETDVDELYSEMPNMASRFPWPCATCGPRTSSKPATSLA